MDPTTSAPEVNPIVDEIDATLARSSKTLAEAEARIKAAEEARAEKTTTTTTSLWTLIQRLSPKRPSRRDRVAEWKELDAAIRPYLYPFARYELKWAGGLSLNGGYWINPKHGMKLCLKTGNVFYCGKLVGNYFDLWLIHLKLEWYDLPRARELLREWINAQALTYGTAAAIPRFTLSPCKLDAIFYRVMFDWGPECYRYRGTAKALWTIFRKTYGPIRTRRLQDLSSNEYLLKFLRYRAEFVTGYFRVEKVSGPRMKEEVWEITNGDYPTHSGGWRWGYCESYGLDFIVGE